MVDITLIAEIAFFILLTIGVVAQLRGKYHVHDYIQTPVVILNTILVIWIMVRKPELVFMWFGWSTLVWLVGKGNRKRWWWWQGRIKTERPSRKK